MFQKAIQQKPSYKERSTAWFNAQKTKSSPAPLHMSKDQIDYLLDRLHGVNDPVGQEILSMLLERK